MDFHVLQNFAGLKTMFEQIEAKVISHHLYLQPRNPLQQILQLQEITLADSVWQYASYTMKYYYFLQFINSS